MNRLPFLIILPLFTACTSITDKDWTSSKFTSAGTAASTSFSGGQTGGTLSASSGVVVHKAGINSNGAQAIAGLESDIVPQVLPGSGIASFSGQYEVSAYDVYLLAESDFEGTLYGLPNNEAGSITLQADFGAGRLTGSAGSLSVDGRFTSDQSLSGSVTYDGVDGSLTGVVGSTEAIGAFHGNDDNAVFSGGFAVSD